MTIPRPSLSDVKALLQQLLEKLGPMPVAIWMSDGRENPTVIGEVVGLMLEVNSSLTREIDAFVDTTVIMQEASGSLAPATSDPGADLLDLPSDGETVTRSPARG